MKGTRIVICSAPSGTGKTTLLRALLARVPALSFSISATTRTPRPHETHGKDYYFIDVAAFEQHIAAGDFVEYEEVYAGLFYGTLKSELARITAAGLFPVFDVDVMGGINLKRLFGDDALAVFVRPPSIEALRERLIKRGTETPESLNKRVSKAVIELEKAPLFDVTILNDDFEAALNQFEAQVLAFIQQEQKPV